MKPHRASELECEATLIDAAIRGGWMVHGVRTSLTAKGAHLSAIKGQKGFPDLVLAHPATGELLVVELKRAPNKVEPEQEVWHRAFEACNITVHVWWVPEELDERVAYLSNQRLKARRT